MSARDEVIQAIYDELVCPEPEKRWLEGCAACRGQAEEILDAISPTVLLQLVIDRGVIVPHGRTRKTRIDEMEQPMPWDDKPLYRLAEETPDDR